MKQAILQKSLALLEKKYGMPVMLAHIGRKYVIFPKKRHNDRYCIAFATTILNALDKAEKALRASPLSLQELPPQFEKAVKYELEQVPIAVSAKWINKDCIYCKKFRDYNLYECVSPEIIKQAMKIKPEYQVIQRCCGVF